MILNARGKPFNDPDAAAEKARRLTEELGEEYIVIPHESGFGVVQKKRNAQPPKPQEASVARVNDGAGVFTPSTIIPTSIVQPSTRPAVPAPSGTITLHPAWRSFYPYHCITIIGAAFALSPEGVLAAFAAVLNTGHDNIEILARHNLFPLLRAVGFFAAGFSVCRTLIYYYSQTFIIGDTTIESRVGVLRRRIANVEYVHIRSVDVFQSLGERLMDLGRVDFSTANSAGIEVTFSGISSPLKIKAEVRRRKDAIERRSYAAVRGQHDE